MMIRAVLLAGVLTGCGPIAATPLHCEGTCVADPAPHCVREACRDDIDCPGGLSCGAAPAKATACAGHFVTTACRWHPPPVDRSALIHGFNTRTMEMHLTPPPDLGFAWTNPRDALFVACAVFTCNPVFTTREVHDEADEPVSSDTMLQQIANADACMLELQTTDTSRTSLVIDGTQRQAAPQCMADAPHDRVIDFVAAGCWAYDSLEVVAASDLVQLTTAGQLASVKPAIPAGATCRHDNDACYNADDPAHPFFGACVAGACAPRCTNPQDCEIAGMELLGRAPTDACAWECRTVSNSLVGVCVPLAQ